MGVAGVQLSILTTGQRTPKDFHFDKSRSDSKTEKGQEHRTCLLLSRDFH